MADSIFDKFRKAWNAFTSRDPPSNDTYHYIDLGSSYAYRPDRPRTSRGNERSIITSIYNRIALDCASVRIEHVRLDEEGYYLETIKSELNNRLTADANKDQTGRAFIQDTVLSMLDEGCIAMVPIDTSINPVGNEAFKILSIRTGKIVNWYPDYVTVNVYNDRTGQRQDLTLPKKSVGIIENPFYSVMNEPNSTMQRLIRKLNLLDIIDDQSGSGKLDLIIQMPYVIKSEARKVQAEKRRKEIEQQLAEGKYGIAYTDGTEHITQLNRSVENKLMDQIQYLTDMLYSQLGMKKEILDGSANEVIMANYISRIIEPIMSAIADEIRRKFLTKTALTQGQSIKYFIDPFRMVPVSKIAEIADKFTRNEIMSSNEVRQIIALKPVNSEEANSLRNKNLNKVDNPNDENVDSGETVDKPINDETTEI